MNETLEKQIESIRQISNDEIQERDEDFYWGTGDLCDRASHEARIELAKEAILIIDELQKKLNEMTICRDNALEQPFKLALHIVKLRDEIDLAIEALRCYAESDDSELAKETLIKLNANL
jgi:hypothetical protein